MSPRYGLLIALVLGLVGASRAEAEEIWLADNTRLYGLVTGLKGQSFEVTLPSAEVKTVPMGDVIAIGFRGRSPRFMETGTQELVFQRGGVLRGQVLGQDGENLLLLTPESGQVPVETRKLSAMIGLPVEGMSGRRAQELLSLSAGHYGANLDELIDRRGSRYPGVMERVDRAGVVLDHEDVLRGVTFAWAEVAGIRLADSDKSPPPSLPEQSYVRLTLRDGSVLDGVLEAIRIGAWQLRPLWEAKDALSIDINEIVQAQVINGKVQYLSQVPIAQAKESTVIAPPHGYRLDRNCEGSGLQLGGVTYPWGIGVHANSELTFDLNQKFDQFRATIGLDSQVGREGSVIFRVLGDGKELYKSPLIKGGEAPVEVAADITGVRKLTLIVGDADGNDLGDAADWCVARVIRGSKGATQP